MDLSIDLPLDSAGFLRRECPHCEQQFKWHHGRTDAAPEDYLDPETYFCPLCGQPAAPDTWWTPEQLDLVEQHTAGAVHDMMSEVLAEAFKPRRSSSLKFTVSKSERPEPPDPLTEPDDMDEIASPCHPWEPIKVPEASDAPFYCLACGAAFAV